MAVAAFDWQHEPVFSSSKVAAQRALRGMGELGRPGAASEASDASAKVATAVTALQQPIIGGNSKQAEACRVAVLLAVLQESICGIQHPGCSKQTLEAVARTNMPDQFANKPKETVACLRFIANAAGQWADEQLRVPSEHVPAALAQAQRCSLALAAQVQQLQVDIAQEKKAILNLQQQLESERAFRQRVGGVESIASELQALQEAVDNARAEAAVASADAAEAKEATAAAKAEQISNTSAILSHLASLRGYSDDDSA